MGNIGSRHVAANQYGVGVVRADCWMEHRPATTGTNDPEITRARVTTISQQDCSNSKSKKEQDHLDRKSTRLNSSHSQISYAVFCLKKKKKKNSTDRIRILRVDGEDLTDA